MRTAFFNRDPKSVVMAEVSGALTSILPADFVLINSAAEITRDLAIGFCLLHGYPHDWDNQNLANGGTLDRSPGLIVCSISSAALAPQIEWVQGAHSKHLLFTMPSLIGAGLVGGSGESREARWKELLEALDSLRSRLSNVSDADVARELSHFVNPQPEAPYALRLLCEAYELNPPGAGKKTYAAQDGSGANFIVDCPEPDEWFELVGAAKPAGVQDTASLDTFTGLMGEAKIEGKNLAEAIIGNSQTLASEVQNFSKKVDEILKERAGI